MELICLNHFGWTVLDVLHSRSLYPMYRPPYSIPIYGVATALRDSISKLELHELYVIYVVDLVCYFIQLANYYFVRYNNNVTI